MCLCSSVSFPLVNAPFPSICSLLSLKVLLLEESCIEDNGQDWLHELALHNSSLEVLNFYMTGLDKINVSDLELIVTNCASLSSLKVSECDILDLRGILKKATALEEFGGGSFSGSEDRAVRFPPKLTSLLGLCFMSETELPAILPIASTLKKLDLQYTFLSTENHCQLVGLCTNLEFLFSKTFLICSHLASFAVGVLSLQSSLKHGDRGHSKTIAGRCFWCYGPSGDFGGQYHVNLIVNKLMGSFAVVRPCALYARPIYNYKMQRKPDINVQTNVPLLQHACTGNWKWVLHTLLCSVYPVAQTRNKMDKTQMAIDENEHLKACESLKIKRKSEEKHPHAVVEEFLSPSSLEPIEGPYRPSISPPVPQMSETPAELQLKNPQRKEYTKIALQLPFEKVSIVNWSFPKVMEAAQSLRQQSLNSKWANGPTHWQQAVRNVIGDRGLEVVANNCKKLRRLRVERGEDEQGLEDEQGWVSHKGLSFVARGCPLLEYIAVYVSDICNSTLETFGQFCKNLKDFRLVLLDKQEQVTDLPLDNGVRALLRGCQKLNRFACYLRPGGLTDTGLGYIGKYSTNVRWMLLGFAGETDSGILKFCKGCPKLERLEIRGCCFSESALAAAVLRLKALKYIWVQGYNATVSGANLLAMARPFWNIEFSPGLQLPRDVVAEDVEAEEINKQAAQILAYYSLAGRRTDHPDSVIPLTPPNWNCQQVAGY
eukprot:Gb_07237 [translate_table: standard]